MLEDILFKKFLIRFVSGIAIYFGLGALLPLNIGEGLTSAIIIVTVSWVFGLMVETVFFNKYQADLLNKSISGTKLYMYTLMVFGFSIFAGFLIGFLGFFIDSVGTNVDGEVVFRVLLKRGIFMEMGMFLWLFTKRKMKG